MSSKTVQIVLENPQKWYTHGDSISGTVCLELARDTNVSSVSVTLNGVVYAKLTRDIGMGQNFLDSAEEDDTVLDDKRQLFPPNLSEVGPKYTMSAGKHQFQFHFNFPRTAWIMDQPPNPWDPPDALRNRRRNLPPSISDMPGSTSASSTGDYAAIKYFLRASVEKEGRLGNTTKSTSTAYCYVPFLPADGDLEHIPTFGASHVSEADVMPGNNVSGLITRLKSSIVSHHDKGKHCNAAGFQVRTESLLTPGVKFSMALSARILAESGDSMTIHRISVNLISTTLVTARNLQDTSTSAIELARVDPNLVVTASGGDRYVELPIPKLSGLVVPESVPPTFSTPQIRRSYRLQIKFKFTHSPGSSAVHRAIVVHPVFIRSGTLTIDGHIEKFRDTFPQSSEYTRRPPEPSRRL